MGENIITRDDIISLNNIKKEKYIVKICQFPDKKSSRVKVMDVIPLNDSEINETYYLREYISKLCKYGLLVDMLTENQKDVEYLTKMCFLGLSKRYSNIPPFIETRINHEIDIINEKKKVGGFLILHDLANYAHSEGIIISPGCGSLPGSLVAYVLGITGVDPIKNGLLCERYMNKNKEGSSFGIRIDVEISGKQKLIDYVAKKYGEGMPKLLEMMGIKFGEMAELSIIKETIENVKKKTGNDINLDKIKLNDNVVFEQLRLEDFNLYGELNEDLFNSIKPNSIEELMAFISLDRPGLKEEYINKYVQGKKNPNDIFYECPLLESILGYTYGCIIYQEQIMWILQSLGHFLPEQSDFGRRALSTRWQSYSYSMREEFVHSCIATTPYIEIGINEEDANEIFDRLCEAAPYCFNKSHVAAYSMTIYYMAWLKHYYQAEYCMAENKFKGVKTDIPSK